MRCIIRPTAAPHDQLDLTERLTAAIAEELWRHYGGNDRLNWFEAEMHLQRMLADASVSRHRPAQRAMLARTRRTHSAARRAHLDTEIG